jgi:hypothetical protein
MELQFISPQQLRPTEEYDSDAALELSRKIARDGFWRVPVLVHRGYFAILDGHHRWQAAIHMHLAMVPCFVCSYADDNIQLGTWRADYCPTVSDVFRAAGTGHLFPRKTTRHQFPKLNLNFAIPLDLLADHARLADGEEARLSLSPALAPALSGAHLSEHQHSPSTAS